MNDKIYFDWDEYNIDHIKRHDIDPFEIEEAYLDDLNKKVLFDEEHSTEFEKRFIVLAVVKSSNKFLKIVFCISEGGLRVITANKATNDKKLLIIYKQK